MPAKQLLLTTSAPSATLTSYREPQRPLNPASPPASGDGFFSGCSVGSPANRNMNKPHQVALTVEAESAGVSVAVPRSYVITVKQLKNLGLRAYQQSSYAGGA